MVRSSKEAHTGWKSSSLFSRVDGGHLEKQVWTRRPFMLGGHTQYLVAKLQCALVFLLLKIPSNEKIETSRVLIGFLLVVITQTKNFGT